MDKPDDEAAIRALFEAYMGGFESFDTRALTPFLNFPLQIVGTSTSPEPPYTIVFKSPDAYVQAIEGFLDLYRRAGVRAGIIERLEIMLRADDLAVADIHWVVLGEAHRRLYDFDAVYTLVRTAEGWRIAAIAHGERPALERCLKAAI